MNVVHFITRMIVGGAQENTLLTCVDQVHEHADMVTLISGQDFGPEGSLLQTARDQGVEVEIIPQLQRNLHPWREWSSYRTLLKLLRRIQPDLIHTHSSKAGILGRAAAAKLSIPVVHTVHGAAFHHGQGKFAWHLYRAAERWAGKKTDRFISVCDAMTQQYLDAGIGQPDDYHTIYSGMNVEPFLKPPRCREEMRYELGFGPDDVVVAKIARLFHLKGHEFILRAARGIVVKNPNVRFLFVGDGILRDQFERQIAAERLTDHFRFTGLIPPTEIPSLIHASDIVAHTSLWEGLARVLPQGLISGRPVVSYDIDGAREVVIPGETGFLLEPESIEPLQTAILKLAADTELRTRLGSTGRARFTRQFRHQNATKQIRVVYEDILSKQQ